MFRKFLEQYIRDLIECSADTYEMEDIDIEHTAAKLERNETLWSYLDEFVYNYIDEYRKD